MKLKVGDTVKVTAGKNKGQTGEIAKIFPTRGKVAVAGVNQYTRHIKPMGGKSGERVQLERPLPVSNVAIINDKNEPDRIKYQVAKDGSKTRVFAKTGKPVPEPKKEAKK